MTYQVAHDGKSADSECLLQINTEEKNDVERKQKEQVADRVYTGWLLRDHQRTQ